MTLAPMLTLLEVGAHWVWRTSLETLPLIALILLVQVVGGQKLGATTRYVLSLLVLVRLLMPVVPVSPWSVLDLERALALPSPRSALKPHSSLEQPERITTVTWSHVTAGEKATPDVSPVVRRGWRASLAAGWAAVAVLLIARAAEQHRRVWWRVRSQPQVTEPRFMASLERAKRRMGVTRPVWLVRTSDGVSPALFGWWRPRVLLPEAVLQRMTPLELEMILLHELAHVRRHDVLLNWLLIAVRALHWFNPLVWLALRRLRADRELVCDAMVLRRLQDADRPLYGETLLKLLASLSRPRFSPSLVPIFSHKRDLKRRITMISSFRVPSRLAWLFTGAVALVICCLTFTRAADPTKPAPAPVAQLAPPMPAPAEESLERLQQRLNDLEIQIRKREREVDQLRTELEIPPDVAEGGRSSSGDDEWMRRLQRERISAESEAAKSLTLLEELKTMEPSQLAQALPSAVPDAELSQLLRQLNAAGAQYNRARLNFGDEHPEVKSSAKDMATTRDQINERVLGIMRGLSAQASAQKAQIKKLDDQLREISRHEAQLAERYRPYFRARRDLQILERVRDALTEQLLMKQFGTDQASPARPNPRSEEGAVRRE